MEPTAWTRTHMINPESSSEGLKIPPPATFNMDELINLLIVRDHVVVRLLLTQLPEHCHLGDQLLPYLPHAYMMLLLVASHSEIDPDFLLHQFILPLEKNRAQVLQELTIRISLCCLGGTSWKDLDTWTKCWVAAESASFNLGVPLKEESLSGGVSLMQPPVILSDQQNEESPNTPDISGLCSNQEKNCVGNCMPLSVTAGHQVSSYGLDQSPSVNLDACYENVLKEHFGFDFKRCIEDPHRFFTDSRGVTPEERVGGLYRGMPLENDSGYSVHDVAYIYLEDIVLQKHFYLQTE